MTGASEQVARLLALAPFLRSRPWVALDEVVEAFGVSRRQALEDLRVLLFCGLPGGMPDDLMDIDLDAARDEGLVNLTNADFLSRPLRLRPDEAMGLIVGLQALQEVATGPAAATVVSALAKLTGLAGREAASWARIDLSAGSPEVREVLEEARRDARRLRLTYDGFSRGETSTPVVDPVAVFVRDGVAYLQAFSLDRDDWRTFRLDRIVAAATTGEPAAEHGTPPSVPEGWFEVPSADNTVTLTLDSAAAWVAEYYPVREVRPAPGDGLVVTLVVSDPGWLTGLLLQLGPQVRAVEPASAAADAVAQAAAALEWYTGGGGREAAGPEAPSA